jgi:hypothetical protein
MMHSEHSTKTYKKPKDAMELAALVRTIAVQTLHNEIPLETAKVFSQLARTAVQAMATQASHNRFAKVRSELTLSDDL